MDDSEAPEVLARGNWMTPAEAAELLHVTPAHVRYLARTGLVEARKFGVSWMVRRESVEQYAQADRRPGPKSQE